MPLSSNFFPQSTGKKNCENWSIFSEDMKKYNSLLFWPTLYIIHTIIYITILVGLLQSKNLTPR